MLVLAQDGGSHLRIFIGPTEGSERSPNNLRSCVAAASRELERAGLLAARCSHLSAPETRSRPARFPPLREQFPSPRRFFARRAE